MKLFLSYAAPQRATAEEINAALSVAAHKVFFDRSGLGSGEGYHGRIREEIHACDAFIFLISAQALREGAYTLTELRLVQERWPNPSGKVLPVMAVPTLLTEVPAYLRAVTILYPQGNVAAEVDARIDALSKRADERAPEVAASAELLRERVAAYKELWRLSRVLPKWPRAQNVTYKHLQRLSEAMRDWYFADGHGMFLSRSAHTAYAALQDSLTAIRLQGAQGVITDEHYEAIRQLCSALRSQLARDVGSRG